VGGEKKPGLKDAPDLMRDHQLSAVAPRDDAANKFGRFIPGNSKTSAKKSGPRMSQSQN
jgi:hypothetical protein